jgi:hypothetical protein
MAVHTLLVRENEQGIHCASHFKTLLHYFILRFPALVYCASPSLKLNISGMKKHIAKA